jgi:hypothetical protein
VGSAPHRLPQPAPSCGAANPRENKFCGQCAAPQRTAPTAKFGTPDAYTPKHLAEKILTSKAALEGERKQVTVLFADLKGSMELRGSARRSRRKAGRPRTRPSTGRAGDPVGPLLPTSAR